MSTNSNPENQTEELTCPITLEPFHDPVIAKDGHIYERAAITKWIFEHGTSPLTREPLKIEDLVPATHLRDLVARRESSVVYHNAGSGTAIILPSTRQTSKNGAINRSQTCRYRICAIVASVCIITITLAVIIPISETNSLKASASTLSNTVLSTYSSSLTTSSPMFNPFGDSIIYPNNNYYYQSIQLFISMNSTYTFTITSSINAYGSIYSGTFNPSQPYENLLPSNALYDGNGQFNINIYLPADYTYFLVITTNLPKITGSFSIYVYNPAIVYFVDETATTR